MRYLFFGLIILFSGSLAIAESKLEIGFDGNIVANRWNPIKLITRDEPDAVLSIVVDRGNLRDGSIPIVYSFDIAASYGIAIFEEDIFIPKWQNFSWKLESSEAVLASGSFDRRLANPQPLNLLISANPSKWLSQLPRRVASVPSNSLTKRLASFDGVESILIDGTAAAPGPAELVAASAAGANVIFIGDLPASHEALLALSPLPRQNIAAGSIARQSEDSKLQIKKRDYSRLISAFIKNTEIETLKNKSRATISLGLSIFALLIIVLMWVGNKAAVMTGFSISILAIILVHYYLIPADKELQQLQSLHINAGGLAKEIRISSVFSLAGGDSSVDDIAYVLEPKQFSCQNMITTANLDRWSRLTFVHKPKLSKALLIYDGENLENRTKHVLSDVFIKGIGFVQDLKPGKQSIKKKEDQRLPELYQDLLSGLEPNTVVAHYGNNLLLATVGIPEISE